MYPSKPIGNVGAIKQPSAQLDRAAPGVSVVIPAHNAADTLARTLESLRAQTFTDWEAIIVDDGSTDATAQVADEFKQKDSRIGLIQQPAGGVSKARNTGIAQARGSWLLFLDADDVIVAEHLAKMLAASERDPFCQAVNCGYARVTPGGDMFDAYCPPGGDLFEHLAGGCLFAIHACMLRRQLVVDLGGFDPALKTCEDWDLWQRAARSGIIWQSVPEVLAHYCMRPSSASTDATRMLCDAMRLLEQGYGPDPRVKDPSPSGAVGLPREKLPGARLRWICWSAGLLIGQGRDATPLLRKYLKNDRDPDLDAEYVAHSLFKAALLPSCSPPKYWEELWPRVEKLLDAFLAALEEQSQAKDLARRARRAIARHAIEHLACDPPIALGDAYAVRVEITKRIEDVRAPEGIERLLCAVNADGQHIGVVELPVCDGTVPASVLSDAIAAELNWQILWKFFEKSVYPKLTIEKTASGDTIRRDGLVLAEGVVEDSLAFWPRFHDRVGWAVFLQELWGQYDWPASRFYESKPEATTSTPIRAIADRIAIEVSQSLSDVQISGLTLSAEVTVGGALLDVIKIQTKSRTISIQQILAAINSAGATELLRMVVREAIIGRSLNNGVSLRARLAEGAESRASKRADQTTGALVLGRHPHGIVGAGASRCAALPSGAAGALLDAAAAASQPILNGAADVKSVLYDPELASPTALKPPGRSTIERLIGAIVRRYRGPNPADVHRCAVTRMPCDNGQATDRLPILMYHRVAPRGAAATARWRVTPHEFARQLQFLHDDGFQSATFEEWFESAKMRKALPGRRVVLTFDDGYCDFYDHAWPLLQKFGFTAYVFLVAARVGQTNVWDRTLGETLPLMNWSQICQLKSQGAHFGSHTCTHALLTSLSNQQVVQEAAGSAAILGRQLGQAVSSFAYPYGNHDAAIAHLIGASGFQFAVTCRPGRAQFFDPPLMLPRIEVMGGAPHRDFMSQLAA